jgi:uncharacterized protein (DUF1330 family)
VEIMTAYLISSIEVLDPVAFAEYPKLVPSSIAKYGGRFVVRGESPEILEGDWSPKIVTIVEFPDVRTVKEWIESAEYAPARKVRQMSAKSDLVVVAGVRD